MLNGAIVGFGNVAQFGHWPAYLDSADARIIGIVDASAERRAAAAAIAPAVPTFASLPLLNRELQIDFIDICTPPVQHAEQLLQGIDFGYAIICEKPIVTNLAALEQIAERSAAANTPVIPVHNWKYAPIIRRATELVESGAIGELRSVEIETLRTRDAAQADSTTPSWRRSAAAAGGGIVMDHGWHAIYLALNWFREAPREVTAKLHQPSGAEVETEAALSIAFASGVAKIFLSWNATERRNRVILRGERGQISIDDDLLTVAGDTTRFGQKLSGGSHHPDWFASMLPHAIAAFRQPARARQLFEEAATCLRVVRRAYEQC